MPNVLHCDRSTFHSNIEPRKNIIEETRKQLEKDEMIRGKLAESRKRLLMLFMEKFNPRLSFVILAELVLRQNIIQADFLKIADKIKSVDNWNKVVDGENQFVVKEHKI